MNIKIISKSNDVDRLEAVNFLLRGYKEAYGNEPWILLAEEMNRAASIHQEEYVKAMFDYISLHLSADNLINIVKRMPNEYEPFIFCDIETRPKKLDDFDYNLNTKGEENGIHGNKECFGRRTDTRSRWRRRRIQCGLSGFETGEDWQKDGSEDCSETKDNLGKGIPTSRSEEAKGNPCKEAKHNHGQECAEDRWRDAEVKEIECSDEW